jgi:hypothetical protein
MGTGNRFNEQEDVNPSEEDDARWEAEKDRRAEAEAKRERSWRESTFPRCYCGATLGLKTQNDGGKLCSRCQRENDAIEAEREYRRQVRDWRNDSGV